MLLRTIGNIREQHLVAERNLSEADEMLYTLRVYNVLVSRSFNLKQDVILGINTIYLSKELQEEELQTCANAQNAWYALVEKSKTLDLRLFRVKAKFKRVTERDAFQFSERYLI